MDPNATQHPRCSKHPITAPYPAHRYSNTSSMPGGSYSSQSDSDRGYRPNQKGRVNAKHRRMSRRHIVESSSESPSDSMGNSEDIKAEYRHDNVDNVSENDDDNTNSASESQSEDEEDVLDIIPTEVVEMVEEIAAMKIKLARVANEGVDASDSDSNSDDGGGEGNNVNMGNNHISIASLLREDNGDGNEMGELMGRLSETLIAAKSMHGGRKESRSLYRSKKSASRSKSRKAAYWNHESEVARMLWEKVSNEMELIYSIAVHAVANLDTKAVRAVFEPLAAQVVSQTCTLLTGSQLLDGLSSSASRTTWFSKSSSAIKSVSNGGGMHAKAPYTASVEARQLQVWAGIRDARAAILTETSKAAMLDEAVDDSEPYSVLVVVDSVMNSRGTRNDDDTDGGWISDEEEGSELDHHTLKRAEEERTALEEWMGVCGGLAECVRLAVDSGMHAVRAVNAALLSRGGMRPVLVVLHCGAESQISSASGRIRTICDDYNVRLCLDGAGLVMLAQHGRSKGTEMGMLSAHALVLTPAVWLGYPATAALTYQPTAASASLKSPGNSSLARGRRANSHDSLDSNTGLCAGNSNNSTLTKNGSGDGGTQYASLDCDAARALGPTLALWWILSRLGPARIRAVVANASGAAETLAQRLKNIPTLNSVTAGVGGTVRFTYTPESALTATAAAASPGALAISGRSHISRVNRALFSETRVECESVLVGISASSLPTSRAANTWLTYSPASVVGSHALWAPPAGSVDALIGALDGAAKRVRVCAASRAAFNVLARGIQDIEAASDAGITDVLTFASFRVVPARFGVAWQTDAGRVRRVRDWTTTVFESLESCYEELIDGDRRFKRKVDQLHKMRKPYRSIFSRVVGRTSTAGYNDGGNAGDENAQMPFIAFLQEPREDRSDDDGFDDDTACWIGLLPSENCKINDGEIAAEIAAEILSFAVEHVIGEDGGAKRKK